MKDEVRKRQDGIQLQLADLLGDISKLCDDLSKTEKKLNKYEKEIQNIKQIKIDKPSICVKAEDSTADEEITSDLMDLPFDVMSGSQVSLFPSRHYESAEDGLISSLNTLGKVDIEYISSVTGLEKREVIENLKGTIYQNPARWNEDVFSGWELSDEYLSGNLVRKYHEADEANKKYNGIFSSNVEVLLSMLPNYLSTDQIYITLGSPWVPEDIIDSFIEYLSDSKTPNRCKSIYATRHDPFTGIWEIPCKTRFRRTKASVRNSVTYGTPKMEMLYLLEATLNMRTPSITEEKDSPTNKYQKIRVINEKETMLAIEKQKLLIETFQEWVWRDKERADRLTEIYDEKYVGIRKRTYNGSFLTFPTMSKSIQLYPYQKNAVARILFSKGCSLIAHDVGAGKTYVMIAAGMEMRRMGISKKNMYCVPNNLIGQWEGIFKEMYPDAKLLVIDPKSFTRDKRNAVIKKIAYEDYDGIIIAYSCFDMLPLSDKYYIEYYNELSESLRDARKIFYSDAPIGRKIKSVNEALRKLGEKKKQFDYNISFDELGINTLFVDEAHNYKNVPIETKVSFNRSINAAGSSKCRIMMDRVKCIQKQNGGRGVVFATGTPISNSVTDLFVIQQYLQSGELALLGIQNFDSWIGMFASQETSYEIDVDTNSYHLVTRFSKFHNLPELTAILSSIADFHQVDHANGIPDFEGYTDTVLDGSLELKDYLKSISQRAEDVRSRSVSRKKDNLLKITTDGRKAALDMRLISPSKYKYITNTKTEACANNVYKIYKDTMDFKGTQLVFCDSSIPKAGFNIYDELRKLLIVKGVKPNEIEYIHNATTEKKREKLFKDVCRGKIRVLIGSTFKLGLGVNVQERLCSIHHLDCPFKPNEIVQREGRILRQGNTNEKVQIYRYITKGSFDAYSWQLLETKQRFISQLLEGSIEDRTGGEIDNTVLDYAEVKALAVGNPKIKERCELMNSLDKLRILQKSYNDNRAKLVSESAVIPDKIKHEKDLIALCELDKDLYAKSKREYSLDEAKEFRALVARRVNANFDNPDETYIGKYNGFDIIVPSYMKGPEGKVIIKGNGKYYLEIGSEKGITTRLNNFLENFDVQIKKYEDVIKSLKQRKAAIKEELSKEESFEEEIKSLNKKIIKIDKELGLKK